MYNTPTAILLIVYKHVRREALLNIPKNIKIRFISDPPPLMWRLKEEACIPAYKESERYKPCDCLLPKPYDESHYIKPVKEKKMKTKIENKAWVFNHYNGRIEKVTLTKDGVIDSTYMEDDDSADCLYDFIEEQDAVSVKDRWVFLSKDMAEEYRRVYMLASAMKIMALIKSGPDYKAAVKVCEFLDNHETIKNRHMKKKEFEMVRKFATHNI